METQKSAQTGCRRLDANINPLNRNSAMKVATERSKINHRIQTATQTALDIESRHIAQVIQSASAARLIGTYRGVPDGADIAIIVWEEGHHDEPVCVLEFSAHRVTYLDAADECHPEIADRLDALGWSNSRVASTSPLACAIRGTL